MDKAEALSATGYLFVPEKSMARNLCRKRKKTSLIHRAKSLRSEIASIKRQKKVSDAEKAVSKENSLQRAKSHAVVPYAPSQAILLVGEGDFSFTTALVNLWEDAKRPLNNIVSTSYDSKSDSYAKYPKSKNNIKILRKAGVNVLTKIDATKLDTEKTVSKLLQNLPEDRLFDKIIFNFPHLGTGESDKEKSAAAHSKFLSEFASSAQPLLSPSGELHLTLKRNEVYKKWRAGKVIEKTSLYKLVSTIEFFPEAYPGYAHKRTVGEERSEENNEDITKLGAYTLVFRKST